MDEIPKEITEAEELLFEECRLLAKAMREKQGLLDMLEFVQHEVNYRTRTKEAAGDYLRALRKELLR